MVNSVLWEMCRATITMTEIPRRAAKMRLEMEMILDLVSNLLLPEPSFFCLLGWAPDILSKLPLLWRV